MHTSLQYWSAKVIQHYTTICLEIPSTRTFQHLFFALHSYFPFPHSMFITLMMFTFHYQSPDVTAINKTGNNVSPLTPTVVTWVQL